MAIKKKKAVKVVSKAKPTQGKNVTVTKKSPKSAAKKSSRPATSKTSPTKASASRQVVAAGKAKPTVKKALKKAAPKKAVKKVAAKKVVKARPVAPVKKAAPKASTSSATKAVKPVAKKAAPAKKIVAKPIEEPKIKKPVQPEVKPAVEATKPVASTEKMVKVGVKTKKQLVAVAPQPVIEVSNHPKTRVKTLLISQPKPETEKNPYYDLANKYSLIETFRQFIKIEGLPVKDFRAQRIDILEHKAVILTSRMAVDHFFRMCNEMRVTVPESMKYFCINEATAYYLQKYIQYRKRKIFFGHQTIQDLVDVIRKNRDEKFLLPAADVQKEQIVDFLDALNIKYTKAVMYRTVSADLTDIKNLNEYDVLVFFTPAGIRSLKHNFPNFVQGNTRIACFGVATANTLLKHGYRLDIYAPNPKNPSMSGALDSYIKESNKR
jgi:uroporphyrinogen-III synthase